MLKRRDWLHLHGKSGGASSSDDETDESSSESQGEGTEDSDDAADGEAAESDDRSDELGRSQYSSDDAGNDEGDDDYNARPRKRLARSFDDISDPDEDEEGNSQDEDVAADGITADHVIKAWTSDDPEVNNFKGIALRCICCNVMLLNRAIYLSHVASKKHQKRLKRRPDGAPEPIQLASEVSRHKEEETETHMERLERIARLAMANHGPSTAAATGRAKSGSQGAKEAEPVPKQAAAAVDGTSARQEAKGRAAKLPVPTSNRDGDAFLADGEDSQSDGEDPDLATGTRTGMAGGCVGSIGGDGGTRKRKRHGNKMGKRERQALKAAIAAGEVPPGTKPVMERSRKKGKGKKGKAPEHLAHGQRQQHGLAAEKRSKDTTAAVGDTVAKKQQQQGGQTKEKKDKKPNQAEGLAAASPSAVAAVAAAAVTKPGSGKPGGKARPGSYDTTRGAGKDATVAALGKTHKDSAAAGAKAAAGKVSVAAASKNEKSATKKVLGTGRKG
ncbi:hypothetical protein Vretimale_561 [Volvox reticuliferus]|uniref:Uncharacterized protein n=1 Tax=Volvox reticuliferus TaxID=1737510 RepID=A0A8J4D3L2_9CHLO|nr:hypothetical protein Vretifemale_2445 [Volvox reticuliferus]GIL94319.1 hypothetical protein Vretimale_561 [Volvox reticuliferus]